MAEALADLLADITDAARVKGTMLQQAGGRRAERDETRHGRRPSRWSPL